MVGRAAAFDLPATELAATQVYGSPAEAAGSFNVLMAPRSKSQFQTDRHILVRIYKQLVSV